MGVGRQCLFGLDRENKKGQDKAISMPFKPINLTQEKKMFSLTSGAVFVVYAILERYLGRTEKVDANSLPDLVGGMAKKWTQSLIDKLSKR